MSIFTDIQAAFDQRLESTVGLPNVAWENIAFTPVAGTSFVRPTLITGASTTATLAGLQSNVGVYSVDVFVESEKGPAALNTLVDSIYDHFKAVSSITEGTTIVGVQGITRTPTIRDEAWFSATIDIQYLTYSS